MHTNRRREELLPPPCFPRRIQMLHESLQAAFQASVPEEVELQQQGTCLGVLRIRKPEEQGQLQTDIPKSQVLHVRHQLTINHYNISYQSSAATI